MKRSIIITDLTGFKPGNPDVCIAGIDRATGECLRPMPYLKFTECAKLKILPGGILTGEFTPSQNLTSPHMEDCHYENLTFDGACPGTEFRQVLAETSAASVETGFEVSLPTGDKVIPRGLSAPRSIITVRAAPRDVEIMEDRYKPGNIKLHFTDSSGRRHRFLPITDLGFYDYAQRHHQSSALAALNADIARQSEVFLRIGLSRRFMNSQGKDGFWIAGEWNLHLPDDLALCPVVSSIGVKSIMNDPDNPIFTIGHSTHSAELFLSLLRQHRVDAVADVRSSPFSRFNPQFNRQNLELSLKENGILYVFLGKELGARTEDRSCYEHGRVLYARLAQTSLFQSGLDRVQQGAQKYRIALMCAEKEPLECHRTLLVGRALVGRGLDIMHILAGGQLKSHDAAMVRLLDVVGVPKADLFRSREELIVDALAMQEEHIAYVDESQSTMTVSEELP